MCVTSAPGEGMAREVEERTEGAGQTDQRYVCNDSGTLICVEGQLVSRTVTSEFIVYVSVSLCQDSQADQPQSDGTFPVKN